MEVTAAASGLDAKDLIEEANGEPFCSGFTRLLAWVAELEKAFQSVVIIGWRWPTSGQAVLCGRLLRRLGRLARGALGARVLRHRPAGGQHAVRRL